MVCGGGEPVGQEVDLVDVVIGQCGESGEMRQMLSEEKRKCQTLN